MRHDDVDYQVFCFAELAHANLFRAKFKGERFSPADGGATGVLDRVAEAANGWVPVG